MKYITMTLSCQCSLANLFCSDSNLPIRRQQERFAVRSAPVGSSIRDPRLAKSLARQSADAGEGGELGEQQECMLLFFAQRCDIVAEPAREGERAAVAAEVVEISNINMRFMSFNTASGMNCMQ